MRDLREPAFARIRAAAYNLRSSSGFCNGKTRCVVGRNIMAGQLRANLASERLLRLTW
jgi:hypothetical protein